MAAQSKLLGAATDVAPPDESRPSSALGVLGFASDSSFMASPAAAVPGAPFAPVAQLSCIEGCDTVIPPILAHKVPLQPLHRHHVRLEHVR